MEFTLRIPEGFWGRIYTHNHYGRSQCYTRGTGGNVYSLRIPGPGGYPDCGTEQVTLKNISNFSQNRKKNNLILTWFCVPSSVTL